MNQDYKNEQEEKQQSLNNETKDQSNADKQAIQLLDDDAPQQEVVNKDVEEQEVLNSNFDGSLQELIQSAQQEDQEVSQMKQAAQDVTGIDYSNVNVELDSSDPEKLNAKATRQGNDIKIGKGNEESLPHELAHISQGKVPATTEKNGQPINDEESLEKNADKVGAQIDKQSNQDSDIQNETPLQKPIENQVIQQNEPQTGGTEYENPFDGQMHTISTKADAVQYCNAVLTSLQQILQQTPENDPNYSALSYVVEMLSEKRDLWATEGASSFSEDDDAYLFDQISRVTGIVETIDNGSASDTEEPLSWQPPQDGFDVCTTTTQANLAMAFLNRNLSLLIDGLPEDADKSELEALQLETEDWAIYLGDLSTEGEDDLPAFFATQMTTFNEDYARLYSAGMRAVRRPSLTAVRSLDRGRVIESMSDDTKDALRAAFAGESEDGLEQIAELIAAVDEYNSKINDWSEYLGYLGDSIRGADTIADINRITGNIGDALERVEHVISAMQTIGTLLDASNQASTESVQAINDMEAMFNGIDLGMNFVRGVPLLSTLWSEYYMPAIEFCISGIRRIAALRSEQMHDLVELEIRTRRDQSQAPELIGEDHFPGGQEVFDFMWQVMRGNQVEPSQEVHDYFADREDLFEAGTGDRMTVTGNGLLEVFSDSRVRSLYWWASNNKERLWPMLYGSRLTPPN